MTDSIIFAGTPTNAADTLRALVAAGVEVELVLTRPDAPVGRKRVVTPSAVAVAAAELGIETVKTSKFDDDLLSKLRTARSQVAIVVAFGVLLKAEAISSLSRGWYNLHYSLLPALRGAAPVQHALLQGFSETGVTLFQIDEGLDTGPILSQVPALVEPNEDAASLLSRLTKIGQSLLLQEIPRLLSSIPLNLSPQNGTATFAPKLTRDLARIDFEQPASSELNRIRATNPEPGSWCLLEGMPFKILEARLATNALLEAGEAIFDENKVICGFGGETSLQLITVQPSGKSPMAAEDWLRGRKMKVKFD